MTDSRVRCVRMPKWGLAMTEGTLASWHVRPGEWVVAGQPLCDIETAKIANEFESPAAGLVARLLAEPNDIVPVGRLIAVLAAEDARPDEIEAVLAAEQSVDDQAMPMDSGPVVQSVQLDHGVASYLEAGTGAGAPIVLVHGLGGSHLSWVLTQSALSARRRTVAIDLPGHGGSTPGPDAGGPGELAATLDLVMGKLNIEAAHLVAHSYGGAVALALIRRNRSRVAAATFIAPMGFGSRPNGDFVRGFARSERKRDLRPVLEMLFDDPAMLSREMVNATLLMLREESSRSAFRRMAETVLACPAGELSPGELSGLPYQVLWGESDKIVALPAGLDTALGGRLHRIAGSGHMPQMEMAETVSRLIESFVWE